MAKHKPRKLLKRAVDALRPAPERYDVYDSEISGLHVRVHPSGAKSFAVFVRAPGARRGRRSRIVLGKLGDLTPDQARAKARKLRNAAAQGEDPAADRAKQRTEPTVREAVAQFLDSLAGRQPRTIATYRQRLAKYVVPTLGAKRISAVGSADIRRIHQRITRAGYATAANRTIETTRALFNWAAVEWPDHLRSNPVVRGAWQRNAEDQRNRILTADERGRLLTAIDVAEALPGRTTGHVATSYCNAFRLALESGMRPVDLVTLHHDNVQRGIQRGRKVWIATWPGRGDARTKTANLRRTLSQAAIGIIERQIADVTGGNGWVFPTTTGTQATSRQLARSFRKVREAAGIDAGVGLYAGRHTYVSEGVMAGVPLAVMGAEVGNASAVHRYAHVERAVRGGDVAELVSKHLRGGK